MRRSLFGNLLFLVLLIGIPIVGVIVWGSQRTQAHLSRNLINSTISRVESELDGFFDPVTDNLRVGRSWGLKGQLDVGDFESLNTLFIPILVQNQQVSSLLIGNQLGDEYLLLRDGDEWRTRLSKAEEWGVRRRWLRFDAEGRGLEDYWEEKAYDTRDRPWYSGAIKQAEGLIYWTQPYRFFTTGDAGMTVSMRWLPGGEDAVDHVIALDVKLKDFSRFTAGYKVSKGGHMLVMTGDGRVFGLPSTPEFQDEKARAESVLMQATELGLPDMARAVALWSSSAIPMETPRRFRSGRGRIWSAFKPFDLGSKRRLWIAVTVPESDFVDEARRQNLMIGGVTLGGLVVAILLGVWMERGLRSRMRDEMSRVRQLGQYTLEEKLGEGGMGTVYRARHALLRRPTAIKLLRPEKEGDEEAIERFEREVQLTAQLTHPNTVAIYDYGRTPDGVFYYAMEYFAGIDVENLVQVYGPVQPARAVHLLRQLCGSLAEAHDFGLIHRDIKPANIMLCERGGVLDVVKVLDFGMVKDVSMSSQALDLTQQNVVMGTPTFLAPEAIKKRDDMDGRSDLYAVGAVAYFMLTARNVFEGETAIDIVKKHLDEAPVPPTKLFPGLPKDLEAIVLDCLAKDPDQRPRNARALIERLETCTVGRQWDQRQAEKWWQESGEMPRTVPGVPSDQLKLTVELQKR